MPHKPTPRGIATIRISLPRKLRADMERKIKCEAYASASEYVRGLILKDLRAEAIEQVDQLLLDGLRSGPGQPYDEKWLQSLKAQLHKRPGGSRA
jgi:antitoxin ParD1/3/4